MSILGGGGGGSSGDGGAAERAAEEARKAEMRAGVNALFDTDEAKARFKTEEDDLAGALRGYYSDDLKRTYENAERALRFGASNTSNIGGSAYADSVGRLNEDNAMGGTRIDEAVQRALNSLRASREDSRARSINLVNAGSGSEAVGAAQSGIRQALDNATSANREQLFGDLFGNLAFTKAAGDASDKNAAALAYFNKIKGGNAFFPTQATGGGTIVKY